MEYISSPGDCGGDAAALDIMALYNRSNIMEVYYSMLGVHLNICVSTILSLLLGKVH